MEKLEGENPLIKESTSPSGLVREICFKITHRLNFLAFVRPIRADKALRNYVVIIPLTHFPQGSKPSGLPPSRKLTLNVWCRGGLPRRPYHSSGNEPFARGQWDCTFKAPPYHAPRYLLLRSGPGGTSTFRCLRPSVSLPSEQYLWARGSAPKKRDIRSKCSQRERRLG